MPMKKYKYDILKGVNVVHRGTIMAFSPQDAREKAMFNFIVKKAKHEVKLKEVM